VTEQRNPGNERRIERVEVHVPVPLLESGVVLIDTPGLGSVYRHNTEAGRAAILEADGAIVMLSADSPLSEQEHELMSVLAERQARTFVVVNKADHLDPGGLEMVRRFITETVTAELGHKPELFCLAARPALIARRERRQPGSESVDFSLFLSTFEHFVAADLVGTHIAAARTQLARVGQELLDALTVRAAAVDFDVATLTRRVNEFRTAAQAQQRAFEEDRVLLAHETETLVRDLGQRLAHFSTAAAARWQPELEEAAAELPVGHLEEGLRAIVERRVHLEFEAFRDAEAARVEHAWRELAERFRTRTQDRVNAVRDAAADLFAVELPSVAVPTVAEERERFFYLFLHVGSSTESLGRLARRMFPQSYVRRRLLAQACRHLTSEFDKHAGRARWDLAQRLEGVRLRFEATMRCELADAVAAILRAAGRAEKLRSVSEAERARTILDDEQARSIASLAAALQSDDD
jgi:hypothetical protein